jgi:dTDP-4-amino-4,6-dideoxygalactose transaminase
MIPRGTPDIGWSDLGFGLLRWLWPGRPEEAQTRIEACWSSPRTALACLSVRSGFDLLLQSLAWPGGSEVLVSAVTIPDMITLLEAHGLVPIPIDVEPATLAVDLAQLKAAIGPRTRAILVAHLFGSRMALAPLLEIARQHGLLVIEDCAQAYDGAYHGDPASDVRMFSFGPIKTMTALGGAIVQAHDPDLIARMRRAQERYSRQPRHLFLRRLLLIAALKLLAHPRRLALFVALCRLRGRDYDQVLYRAMRGFAGDDLLRRIRQQPAAPLLHLLLRRITRTDPGRVAQRAAFAERLLKHVPGHARLGDQTQTHAHWVVPIRSAAPDTLVRVLRAYGFDATRTASSMVCVSPSPARALCEPVQAQRWLAQVVYLPLYQPMSPQMFARLGQIICDLESNRAFIDQPETAMDCRSR